MTNNRIVEILTKWQKGTMTCRSSALPDSIAGTPEQIAKEISGWISVETEPVPDGENILVYCEDGRIRTAIKKGNYYAMNGQFHFDVPQVTHWTLPEPPED